MLYQRLSRPTHRRKINTKSTHRPPTKTPRLPAFPSLTFPLFTRQLSTTTTTHIDNISNDVHPTSGVDHTTPDGIILPVLNSFISRSGLLSRRAAIDVINQSRVFVNESVCTTPFYRVQPTDTVKMMQRNGKIVTIENTVLNKPKTEVLLFNKPAGYSCSRPSKHQNNHTIYEVLPPAVMNYHYCGRIDMPCTGLLLLSNDGVFVNNVAHPRNEIEKEYLITTVKPISPRHIMALLTGIKDGEDFLQAKSIENVSQHARSSTYPNMYSITMVKGLKREVRRMVSLEDNNHVTELQRIRIGSLLLGDVPTGSYRSLKQEELDLVFKPFIPTPGQASHIPLPPNNEFSEISKRAIMRPISHGSRYHFDEESGEEIFDGSGTTKKYNGVAFDEKKKIYNNDGNYNNSRHNSAYPQRNNISRNYDNMSPHNNIRTRNHDNTNSYHNKVRNYDKNQNNNSYNSNINKNNHVFDPNKPNYESDSTYRNSNSDSRDNKRLSSKPQISSPFLTDNEDSGISFKP